MSPSPRSIVRSPFIAALLAIVALGLATGTALAHAELDTADPADGAVLDTPPTTITLTFTERLDPAKSSFRLLDAGGDNLGTGEATGPKTMTLDDLTLGAGAYLIKWTSASADDGDIERGQLTFTVEEAPASSEPSPSPTASPTPNPTEQDSITPPPSASAAPVTPAPTVAPTPAAPTAAPTPAPSAAPTEPASSTGDVLIPIVVGLLLVAGIGAFVLRRSRGA